MKYDFFLKTILIFLILIGISFPRSATQAQNDDQPLDDKFVAALVAMAVNHDMMEGKDEIRDLAALHGFVSDYYDDRIATASDSTNTQWLNLQKKLLTSKLEEEIKIKRGIDILNKFLSVYTLGGAKDSQYAADEDVRKIVSGYRQDTDNYDPSTDYFNAMHSHIMTDFPTLVNVILDIDIINSNPSLAPSISDSSSWSIYSPAIQDNNSTSNFDNNNGSSTADFWDQTDDDSSSPPGNVLKPVRFVNNGFESVTVVVETYEPAPGYAPQVSSASTTVFPESTSSSYLELPLGTYTFCYYWQLDTDVDNDDYFDYHHRTTSAITLNNNSSDNSESAIAVTLNPESVVSNPNGKCGEEIVATTNDGGLIPEEKANEGTHDFLVSCTGDEMCEGETEILKITISFSASSMTFINEQTGLEDKLPKVGINKYAWTNDFGNVFYLSFVEDGFTMYVDGSDTNFYYTRQD